ncbi:MAG: DUF423 domain-containing protein [Candidatus Sericytochromatia bacterium]|nr:DUF423 domain-containing protein [Candidatus Sericytochromatia bacterium]
MKVRVLLAMASALGATGVLAGAFGAHALKQHVSAARLETWGTAAHYQQVHAVALLALAAWSASRGRVVAPRAAWCLLAGILVFSGSLYTLVLSGKAAFGAITPIGGVLLIVGWLLLAVTKPDPEPARPDLGVS